MVQGERWLVGVDLLKMAKGSYLSFKSWPCCLPREKYRKHHRDFRQLQPHCSPSVLGIPCLYFSHTFLLAPPSHQSTGLCFYCKMVPLPPWTAPHLCSLHPSRWASSEYPLGLIQTRNAFPWVDLGHFPHQAPGQGTRPVSHLYNRAGYNDQASLSQRSVYKCDEVRQSYPKGRTWANQCIRRKREQGPEYGNKNYSTNRNICVQLWPQIIPWYRTSYTKVQPDI